MSIRVEIEGGSTLEFPDGTSDSIIDATAKRYLQPDKPEKKETGWFSDTLSNIGTGMSKMAQSESTGARATQESVGNIASGALAWIPAGLYGAAKLYSDTALKGVKGTDYGAIKQDVNSIQNALTYSPKGEQGKLLAETLTSPLTAVSNKFIEGAEYSKKQAEKAAQAGDLETAKKWLAAESAAEFGSEAWMFALPGIFKGAKAIKGIPKKLSVNVKSLQDIIPEEVAKGDYAVTPDVREQLATKKPLVVEQKPVVPVIKEAPVVQAVKPVAKPRQKNEFRPPVKSEPKGVTLTSGIDPTQIMPVLRSLSESTSQFVKKYETPPEIKKGVQSAIKSMVDHHRLNREAEFLSQQLKKVVNDVVPNPERQMLITHAVEHKLQGKYFDQLNEIEKGVARWATGENQKLRQFLEKNGAIELMPDTNSVTHVYHWWINEKTGEPYSPMYGRFSKGAPQGKKRTIPTYEYGMLKGQKPATTNIGELIGLEWESATRANSANKLFQSLHEIKGDSSTVIKRSPKGSPQQIRLIESWSSLEQQGLTNGYKRYSSPFLNKAKTHISDDGRLVTMKGDVGIKEELYPHVRAYLESPTYGKLSEIAFAAKNLKLSGTLFHVVSLGMQELANLRMPFVHVPKGLKLRQELGPGMKLLHSEGLELLKGYEDFGGKGNLFRGEHPVIKYANIAAKPLTIFRDFTFDIVQPGMKMSMADFLLNKYLPKYMEKTGWSAEQVMKAYEKGEKMPPAIETRMRQCAREVVQKVDGHFSGEDYKRGLLETNRFMADLYFSPEAKKFWQMALLSPTWQREHLLVAKNVAKSFMPNSLIKKLGMSEMGPIKGAYRRYALGAALMISAVDMWNYMSTGVMDGKSVHMWDNPEGKKFGVRAWWNEPAYIDYNKDGERIYHPPARAYIRPLKSVFEVAEGTTNIVHKVSNKLAPLPKAVGEQFFGSKKYGGTTDMPNRAKDFMLDLALPMMANQVIMAAQGKQSAKAALLPFFGMPVSREKTKTKNLK